MTIEKSYKEDIFVVALRHAFTCKFYCNIIPYLENNLKLNNRIYLDLDIWELLKYISNANKILEDSMSKKIIDLSKSNILDNNTKILKQEIEVFGIQGNSQSDNFIYEGKITEFKPIDIEKLTDVEKEAFYGFESQTCLNMENADIKSTANIQKVKEIKFN